MDGCEGDQVQCGETQGGKEEDLKDHKEEQDLKDLKDHKEKEDRGVEKAGVGKGTGWHWWRSGVVTMVANASAPHFVDNHRRILWSPERTHRMKATSDKWLGKRFG